MRRRTISSWLCLLLCLGPFASIAARAVVIDSGDGTGNTTPPADDFGFENVGVTNTNLTGVYLGDGWVLTANHVGPRPITLLGVTYQVVPGSDTQLQNPDSSFADLRVYRINGFPALPSLVLSNATPVIGEQISCSGFGWTRRPTLTTWNASWQEGVPPPVYSGYKALGFTSRRWGTNLVSAVGNDIQIGSEFTRSIEALFDDVGGTVHESQAVVGDSGGGCFAKRSGTWELVGVMFAMLAFPNQPGATAVYGNATIAADVAFYREQIETLTPPLGEIPALPAAGGAALAGLLVLAARGLGYAASPRRAGSSAG